MKRLNSWLFLLKCRRIIKAHKVKSSYYYKATDWITNMYLQDLTKLGKLK